MTKNQIIQHIESGSHKYVIEIGYIEIIICIIQDPVRGNYLRSDPLFSEGNALETLPGIRYFMVNQDSTDPDSVKVNFADKLNF